MNYHFVKTQFGPMTTLKKSTFALCISALVALNVPNNAVAEEKITDELLDTFEVTVEMAMATYNIPGAAIAVVEGDDIIYVKGFGSRNRASQEPVTAETRFNIASITKSMTATMVASLVDDRLLKWNQRVKRILPDLALPTKKLTKKVRVRHLMQMNTGLGDDDPFTTFYKTTLSGVSAEETLESLTELPVIGKLGKVFFPNNNVFASAGFIAAIASGAEHGNLFNAYTGLMQERLFNPIGMESALFTFDPSVNNYAIGHAFNLVTNTVEPFMLTTQNIEGYAPASGIVANVSDVARYVIMQLNKGIAPNGNRVVSAKNLKKTWKPKTDATDNLVFSVAYPMAQSIDYGTGLTVVKQVNGVKMIGHPGGIFGFVSDMAFIPDADVGIVILTNRNFFDGFLTGAHFIAVVRESLFELIYGFEPTVAEAYALQYQQSLAEIAMLQAVMQVNFTPDMVAPYLGNYEKGWQVELREDGTLWVILSGVQAYQLVLLPDGSYMVSNNGFFGIPVHFSIGDNGPMMAITMMMATTGTVTTEIVSKLD